MWVAVGGLALYSRINRSTAFNTRLCLRDMTVLCTYVQNMSDSPPFRDLYVNSCQLMLEIQSSFTFA